MGNFDYCSTKYQADDLNIGDAFFKRGSGESQLWKGLTTMQLNNKQMISISAMLPSVGVHRVSLNCGNV